MKATCDKHVQGKGGKNILVVGCVHGDELLGEKVINELRKITVIGGTLVTVIANKPAMSEGKRFIDQDLNRSFPGNQRGNREERLAHDLLPLLRKADIVLDIHSTTTNTTSAIILTKVNESIKELIKVFNPKHVVVMKENVAKTALTGHCKAGISFEYGKEGSVRAFKSTLADILKILQGYGVVEESKKKSNNINNTEYFKVLGVLARPEGLKLEKTIKNFMLVRKGEVIARKGETMQKAPRNFYPLLFGPKSYKEIWGFMAKKVNEI